MNITATNAGTSASRIALNGTAAGPLRQDRARGIMPLTDSDIALVQAITGTKFNWPPGPDEGFPQLALDLSMVRMREADQGIQAKVFDAKALQELHRMKIIDDTTLTKGTEYLSSGKKFAGPDGILDLTQAHPFARMEPGTVASDGSVYL